MENKKCIHCGTTENVGGWGRCRACMDKEKQVEKEYWNFEFDKIFNKKVDN